MKLDCLILAAGNSTRFGRCKLLAEWRGQPLIATTLDAASTLEIEHIKIIAGAYYPELVAAKFIPKELNSRVELVEFSDWRMGMGHSLAFGIEQFATENAALILLGDQPLISAQDLQNLRCVWNNNAEKIVCASFGNTLGVPAIFPPQFKAELRACSGDRGAKSVLLRHSQILISVPMPHAEFDVDTPEDLDILSQKNVV
jgi:molybdenum cofactor cytidylyltransferase